jgi:cell division protein FtsZ
VNTASPGPYDPAPTGARAEVPSQHAAEVVASYVPAPVSFVSDEDENEDEDEEAGKPGYATGETRDDGPAPSGSGWKDPGRYGGADKTFDVNSSRRRPVVFEEDDDLDVPDFLK